VNRPLEKKVEKVEEVKIEVPKVVEKAKVVEELSKKSGFDPLVSRFLILLAKKGRFSELREVLKAFRLQRLESEGGVLGHVVSADALSDADVQALVQAFEKKTGKKVRFEISVDSKLLAGFKVTLQGKTYDGTLRSQLDRAKAVLTSRS
jgi:F-type H+-transporting ATPase subunit delta